MSFSHENALNYYADMLNFEETATLPQQLGVV